RQEALLFATDPLPAAGLVRGNVGAQFAEPDRTVAGLADLGLPVVAARVLIERLHVAANLGVRAWSHAWRAGEHGDYVDGQVEYPEFLGRELMQVLFELIEPAAGVTHPYAGGGHRPG